MNDEILDARRQAEHNQVYTFLGFFLNIIYLSEYINQPGEVAYVRMGIYDH